MVAVLFSGLLTIPNMFLSDRLYQRAKPPEAPIYILGIDEAALSTFGPFQTWTRSVIAEVIEILNANAGNSPAVIGVDIMYFGYTDQEHDTRLAEACALQNNVIMASRVQFADKLVEDESGVWWDRRAVGLVELPYRELLEATTIGHINFEPDIDGVIRQVYQYIDLPSDIAAGTGYPRFPGFGLSVYEMYAETKGLPKDPNVPLQGRFHTWRIPYTTKTGGFYDGFSIVDVLNGNLPPEMFANCIVLIGPYTPGLTDRYPTPIDPVPMYGVEIHANVVEAMVRGVYYMTVPDSLAVVITFTVLLILFIALFTGHPVVSAFLMLTVSGVWILLARFMVFPPNEGWFLFGNIRYLLPPLQLPLGAFLLYIGMLVVHYLGERRQKRLVTDTFKKYVDPGVIEDIFTTGLDNLQLGGRMVNICAMFVDIRGFTPMSEIMSPPELVSMLNKYLEVTSSAVFKHKGTLDKFIGDATMAYWGAPMQQNDMVYNAVLAAWDIAQNGLKMEAELLKEFGRVVTFGIGMNCGEAVVGNVGTTRRMDYTAIGDTINTAARLESNARPGQILMSESVYRAVEDRVTVRDAGKIPLKGKSEEMTVYALESIREYEGIYEPLASALLEPGK